MAAIDPRRTYKLWLDIFADLPFAERPVFVYRRITGAEYLDIAKQESAAGKSVAEQTAEIYEAVKVGLVDWTSQTNAATGEPVPFDAARLSEVLDPMEAQEIIGKRLFGARTSGDDLKNSAPQS